MKPEECKYGSSCYRQNIQHFLEFSHPYGNGSNTSLNFRNQCFIFLVEEIAQKINNGMIEEIISCNLDPKVLEQAQMVSELIVSGELNTISPRWSTMNMTV